MLATSLDGQWAIVRRGREVVLLDGGAAPPVGRLTLDTEDVDLAFVGPPAVLVAVTRAPAPNIVLYQPPSLEAVARLELDQRLKIVAVTGARLALLGEDGKAVRIVRVAGRGLSAQPVDVGSPVEFAVGLDRNQLLFSLMKKLEVWDAVSARPLLRLQIQLPPPPRAVGAAHGHLWCTRPGTDEVYVYRLSDGRPFRHHVGDTVRDVIAHPASPVIVLVTPGGLVRLHCFAHALSAIDAPWTPGAPLALIGTGDDVQLLGLADAATAPWRVPLGAASVAPAAAPVPEAVEPTPSAGVTSALDKLRELRERASGGAPAPVRAPITAHARVAAPAAAGVPVQAPVQAPVQVAAQAPVLASVSTLRAPAGPVTWRDTLAAFAGEVARGVDAEVPSAPFDCELGDLAHRLALPAGGRRALTALYALYLVGEPAPSIARLAQVLGDWAEPLGHGELGALAMLRRRGGRVALRAQVTELLDGHAPHAIRVVGDAATTAPAGAARLERAGRSDDVIERELAADLGRIAVIVGAPAVGLLEARLHGATAVALAAPLLRPAPWPREASLVVVTGTADPAWVSALPAFASPSR